MTTGEKNQSNGREKEYLKIIERNKKVQKKALVFFGKKKKSNRSYC